MGGAPGDSVAALLSLPLYTKLTHQHTRRLVFLLVVSFLWEVNLWAFFSIVINVSIWAGQILAVSQGCQRLGQISAI